MFKYLEEKSHLKSHLKKLRKSRGYFNETIVDPYFSRDYEQIAKSRNYIEVVIRNTVNRIKEIEDLKKQKV